jgi:trans-aconitate methyltransferase
LAVGEKSEPQRLKPQSVEAQVGTAEAVPFLVEALPAQIRSACFRWVPNVRPDGITRNLFYDTDMRKSGPLETPTQEWNSSRYAENARFVSDLGQAVLDLLNPRPGERILDLGCGDGALTEKIATGGAQVVGVDASSDMVTAAKRRGIDARVMDAYSLNFCSEFDAVFSNAAMHWMKRDPDAVVLGVRRALKPSGRFAAEMGGHGCVAAITVALCATLERYGIANPASLIPWYFPTPEDYRKRLERAGFEVEYIALIPRPTPLPTGMRRWLETFVIPFTKSVAEERRAAFLDEVTERLRPVLCDDKRRWTADYIRLRFLARVAGL